MAGYYKWALVGIFVAGGLLLTHSAHAQGGPDSVDRAQFDAVASEGSVAVNTVSDWQNWLEQRLRYLEQALRTQIQSVINSIAGLLGLSGLEEVSSTVGNYTYNSAETGMNVVYKDAVGDSISIEMCVNGAYYVTYRRACSSGPNSCGMRGAGFITQVISNERQLGSSTGDCAAQVPSDSLCTTNPPPQPNPPTSCISQNICSATDGNIHDSCTGAITQACQYGCSVATNTCHASCQSTRVCNADGTKVVNSCTGAVIEDCTMMGGAQCVNGVCVFAPMNFRPFDADLQNGQQFQATGHLQAAPTLVASGTTVRLYWNVAHARSCTITGTNGDSWNATLSGTQGKTSSAITNQTIFTISCSANEGITPASIAESVTVNLVPQFIEP